MASRRETRCPMCSNALGNLSRHLKCSHKVTNVQERKILVTWASGHINVRRSPCPVSGCKYKPGQHLDRHIHEMHNELSLAKRVRMLNKAKTLKALELLAELRASGPTPPMTSIFDLEDSNTLSVSVQQGGEKAAPAFPQPACGTAQCAEIVRGYKLKIRTLIEEKSELESRVMDLQQSLSVAKRVTASMKALAKRGTPHVSLLGKRKRQETPEESAAKGNESTSDSSSESLSAAPTDRGAGELAMVPESWAAPVSSSCGSSP